MNARQLNSSAFVDGIGESLEILDPATGGSVAKVAEASNEQTDAAATAVAAAFKSYARTTSGDCAAIQGFDTGCDMSVYALDASTAIRHGMVAHG